MFWLGVDRDSPVPFIHQIHRHLRRKIDAGELAPGDRLPSSRALAGQLHVSRNVVREVYAQLVAEGFLESRPGSGMFVAARAKGPSNTQEPSTPRCGHPGGTADVVDFRSGPPALELIPRTLLARHFRAVCLEADASAYGYGCPEGHPALRQALAIHLARTRGVRCRPDQLLITSGTAEGLFIAAKLLIGTRTVVGVEDPMHVHFQETFRFCGAELHPLAVDGSGLRTEALWDWKGSPAFLYVTPSHQFPFGGALPPARRAELLRFAQARGCLVVEDDYEREFHYVGTAAEALHGMSPEEVLYLGTFSKVLSPSLRLGYLVLPDRLVAPARKLKYLVNHHAATFDQLVLARLLEGGELERHGARMKLVYRKRQQELLRCLDEAFGARCAVSGTAAGLHVVARFDGVLFDASTMQALETGGVRLHPVERHTLRKGLYTSDAMLSFGHLPESRIQEGVRRLQRVFAFR